MITVTAKAWNPETRAADEPVYYVARDIQEALNWVRFNQHWMRDFRINGAPA